MDTEPTNNTGNEPCQHGRGAPQETSSAPASPGLPFRHPQANLSTYVHTVCRRCHHWMDAQRFKFSPDSNTRSDLDCPKCGTKVFSLGRRSTCYSMLSQLSRPASIPRRSSLNVCIKVSGESSPSLSNTRRATEASIRSISRVVSEQAGKSGDVEKHLSGEKHTTVEHVSKLSPVDAEAPRASATPSRSDAKDQQGQAARKPRGFRRLRLVRACVKKVVKLIDPDAFVEISQSTPSVKMDDTTMSMRDTADAVSNSRADQFTHHSGQLEDTVSLSARNVMGASHEDATDAKNQEQQSPKLQDEADDAQTQKSDPGRLSRINQLRSDRTPRPQQFMCQCESGSCPCTQSGRHHFAAVNDMSSTPELTSSTSSRAQTNLSQYSTSSSINRSIPSPPSSFFRFHLGSQFSRERVGQDSVVSDHSGQTTSRHQSWGSRPSRMSSINISESSSSGSRPGSSGRMHHSIATSGAPSGLSNVIQAPTFAVENRVASAPQSISIPATSPVVEEPLRNGPRSPPLRVDTGLGRNLTPVNEHAHNEPESHGNSSVTVTQERQNQIDQIRGSKEEDGVE